MCVDRFHIVSLFLSNPCTPSTLSKEAFVYCVCPTEIPQPPFAWKCYVRMYASVIGCMLDSIFYLCIYQFVHTVCTFTYHLKRNQNTKYEDCFSLKEISNADA